MHMDNLADKSAATRTLLTVGPYHRYCQQLDSITDTASYPGSQPMSWRRHLAAVSLRNTNNYLQVSLLLRYRISLYIYKHSYHFTEWL